MANLPYVGAGVLGSSVGMDKDVMKRLLQQAGLPIVDFLVVLDHHWQAKKQSVRSTIENELGYPCFVKPANLGSSVGISKVKNAAALDSAMDLAAQYDRKIIIEKGLEVREIECSVLGNDDPRASLPGEIVPSNEFYDYESKYVGESSRLLSPPYFSFLALAPSCAALSKDPSGSDKASVVACSNVNPPPSAQADAKSSSPNVERSSSRLCW